MNNSNFLPLPTARVVVISVEELVIMLEARHEKFFRRLRDELLNAEVQKNADRYLSRDETAQMLNVTLPTLSRYVRERGLKKCKVGNRVVFRLSDIEAWLKQHESQTSLENKD